MTTAYASEQSTHHVLYNNRFDTKTFVNVVLSNPSLLDLVFDYCSPATLLRLARTCKLAHATSKSYMRREFKIDRLLLPYFPSPLAFRQVQARTGTLISGSTALQFFERTQYQGSDLDLYVFPRFRQDVETFLRQEGYVCSTIRKKNPDRYADGAEHEEFGDSLYEMTAVAAVITFEKKKDGCEEKTIQVIEAKNCPMEAIMEFHSSKSIKCSYSLSSTTQC